MGNLYLTTNTDSAARRLATELTGATTDPFQTHTIVVPNRNVKKWLQLSLARHTGICANLRLIYLDLALWEQLAPAPEPGAAPPEPLDDGTLSQMILALLLSGSSDTNDELAPLRAYIRRGRATPESKADAAGFTKAAQLAARLSKLFHDFEHTRPDWPQQWLRAAADARPSAMLGSQQALYQMIFAPGGLRDRVAAAPGGSRLLTLGELLRGPATAPPAAPTLHLFAITQVSPLQVRVLQKIAATADLHLYCISPLAGRISSASDPPRAIRDLQPQNFNRDDPISLWGKAAVECLTRLRPLFDDSAPAALKIELLDAAEPTSPATVLGAFHDQIVTGAPPPKKLPQDTSLQVLACPSIRREAETVHNSILDHLQRDPALRLTDIAVLVPDMSAYRGVLTTAFAAPGRKLPYNLTDFSARDASAYAQAVIALLDLPLGRFARVDVCNLLINPCFLAAAGVTRDEADNWADWSRALGICHGFDEEQRRAQGYGASELFTWSLGLRRLRFGRILDCGCGSNTPAGAQAFGQVVPYAQPPGQDDESLGRFCELIEQLFRRVDPLRDGNKSGAEWRAKLQQIINQFLAVPEDRPEERQVRDAVQEALAELETYDRIRIAQPAAPAIDLNFVRQHLGTRLASLGSTIGTYLTGGVTISELQPLRPLPFKICYVLGLGEGNFPGQTSRSALDLRHADASATAHKIADLDAPDLNRLLFLETLLSTGSQLYLSYVSRDLQRDRELVPSAVITQLLRSMQSVLAGKFEVTNVPLLGSDVQYLRPPSAQAPQTDVLVNHSPIDRLTCLLNPANQSAFRPPVTDPAYAAALTAAERSVRTDFSPDAADAPRAPDVRQQVRTGQLKKFLQNPVEASLRRHLGLDDEDGPPPIDDEPFYTVFPADWQCKDFLLRQFILRAAASSSTAAIAALDESLEIYVSIARKSGQMPDGSFGAVDQDELLADIRQVIGDPQDEKSLASFIDTRRGPGFQFIPRLLVGQSRSAAPPLDPHQASQVIRLPALQLDLPNNGRVTLHGATQFIWRGPTTIDALAITPSDPADKLPHHILEPAMTLLAAAATGTADWLTGLPLTLTLAKRGSLVAYEFGVLDPTKAREYLATLCTDYLNAARFDVLPIQFAVDPLLGTKKLEGEKYQKQITHDIEDAAHDDYSSYRPMELLEILQATVPADALAIAQRRFAPFLRALGKSEGGGT